MKRASTQPPGQRRDLFLTPRPRRLVHYTVVAAVAGTILFFYYAYKESMPTPPGHYLDWFWDLFYFEFKNHVLGIFMLAPILYATFTLGWKQASLVVLVLLAAVIPYVVSVAYDRLTLFESLSLLLVPPALIISVEMFLVSNAQERRAKAEKQRERAEVMRQLFAIQEDERLRISQELHDAVAQTLLVNASTAHNLLEGNGRLPDTTRAALEAIKQNSLDMVTEIRIICQDLRPSILDNLGLVSALKWLVDKLAEESGLSVEFVLTGEPQELKQDEEVAVFRIVQEVLNNVQKHSEAAHMKFRISFDADGLSILIGDDGQGFEPNDDVHQFALYGKLGIMGMNERAQSIGAVLQIRSTKGAGTEVQLRLKSRNVAETTSSRSTV